MKITRICFLTSMLLVIFTYISIGKGGNLNSNKHSHTGEPTGLYDEVDLYDDQLRSGDAMLVQNSKNEILRRYWIVDEYTQKRIEDEIIKIIEVKDQSIPDTVDANRSASVSSMFRVGVTETPKDAKSVYLCDAKTEAIFLAGILRLKRALPALAKQLNYVTPRHSSASYNQSGAPVDDFPASISMIMIGEESEPYLIKIVKKHPDKDTRILAGRTIQVMHKYKDIKPLEDALNQSADSTERKNLDFVINQIKYLH